MGSPDNQPQVVRFPGKINLNGAPVAAAIGVFDGVHTGHQAILRQAAASVAAGGGRVVAVTFDRHPASVVAPTSAPPLLQSTPQRLRALANAGADAICLIEFTPEFSLVDGETFVRTLATACPGLATVWAGPDFAFGHRRSGNAALLRRLGTELGFTLGSVEPVLVGGSLVSSTRVRTAVQEGRLEEAARLLGRPYSFAGAVVRGDQLGRKLGFPTANLATEGRLLPPRGVYAATVLVEGRVRPAAVNIGRRPTVTGSAVVDRVEAHLPGFDGDLYGQEIELVFGRLLRPEMKFDGMEALKRQIAADVDAVLRGG